MKKIRVKISTENLYIEKYIKDIADIYIKKIIKDLSDKIFKHYIYNVDDKRARQTSEQDTFSHSTPPSHSSFNYSMKKNDLNLQRTSIAACFLNFRKRPST